MKAISFTFENAAVRTLGNSETPLFVALDVATALGYANPKAAPAKLVDSEDLIKAEIETKGGKQIVNCVNESGLYALIFGSKLRRKSFRPSARPASTNARYRPKRSRKRTHTRS